MRPFPFCVSARPPSTRQSRTPVRPICQRQRCGSRKKHCHQKHRWASAATPAQRIATHHPQVPLRKACDVFNGTNLLRKDNPRWPLGNGTETAKLLAIGPARLAVPQLAASQVAAPQRMPFRVRVLRLSSWLTRMPHGLGTWLFHRGDAEAGWRNWQVTEIRGGLARGYRDWRFDVLRQLDGLATRSATQPGTEPSTEPSQE